MSQQTTDVLSSSHIGRSRGRGLVWAAVGLCVLGMSLVFLQMFVMKLLYVPWYAPVLATIGVLFMLRSLRWRRSVGRVVLLVLVLVFAGLQWLVLAVFVKLPDYEGPARAGEKLPPFETTLADGRAFTEKDLEDGRPTVMTFFRGRW